MLYFHSCQCSPKYGFGFKNDILYSAQITDEINPASVCMVNGNVHRVLCILFPRSFMYVCKGKSKYKQYNNSSEKQCMK